MARRSRKKAKEDPVLEEAKKYLKMHPEPDEPYINIGRITYSARQLFEQMEKRTPLGIELIANWREYIAKNGVQQRSGEW